MTGLLITLGILLFVAFILLIKLRLVIDYHGNDVTLTLKVLGLPFRLLPKKVKKRKIRLSDYSYKAVEKRKRKEEKKKGKKKKPSRYQQALKQSQGIRKQEIVEDENGKTAVREITSNKLIFNVLTPTGLKSLG